MNYISELKKDLASILSKYIETDIAEIIASFELPPREEMGDLAFPCFKLAKKLRKSPMQIAADLETSLSSEKMPDLILNFQALGPYLNFNYNRTLFYKLLFPFVEAENMSLVTKQEITSDPVVIDFSSPNIAKPFHVGHAFSTVIGQSLANLFAEKGYKVRKYNHLGDHGTQFGKLIVAFELFGDEEKFLNEPINELLRVYTKFHEAASIDPSLEDKARLHFKNLEDGKEYEVKLWQRFRNLSLQEFNRVYKRLGVSFDNFNGENFYSNLIPDVVSELSELGLLTKSEGAMVVDLDENIPPCLIIKKDGASTYASRDLASCKWRYENEHFYKNIYVVGMPQALHFRQVFSVLEKAKKPYAKDCIFVGFGLVKNSDGSAMATRKGDLVFLEDLLDEAVRRIRAIIITNNQNRIEKMSEEEIIEISEKIGVASIFFAFIKNGRERDILFSFDEILSFEGDTAPYLLYSYARCRSLLNKAGDESLNEAKKYRETKDFNFSDLEYSLLKNILALGGAIEQALNQFEPSVLTKQLCHLAHIFNKFYAEAPILSSNNEEKYKRLLLVDMTARTIKYGLSLLNIPVVERM